MDTIIIIYTIILCSISGMVGFIFGGCAIELFITICDKKRK